MERRADAGHYPGRRRGLNAMRKWSIISAALVTLGGGLGGLSLAEYTTRGMGPGQRLARLEPQAYPVAADEAFVGEPGGPDHYSCKGCGPTLAERQMAAVYYPYKGADYLSEDHEPLPPYEPMPFETEYVDARAEADMAPPDYRPTTVTVVRVAGDQM